MNYFSSDFHLGHRVIVPKYRDFVSQEEHDNKIFDMIAKLNKRDVLFILGDFIFDSEKYDYYIEELTKLEKSGILPSQSGNLLYFSGMLSQTS